jgi:ABC-type uncharacterized transport system substrate-binding protein
MPPVSLPVIPGPGPTQAVRRNKHAQASDNFIAASLTPRKNNRQLFKAHQGNVPQPEVELVSYGVVFPPMWRGTADYVARILKGAKPADLPIEQHTKFELVVDPKTARALGITIPNGMLLAADQLIG